MTPTPNRTLDTWNSCRCWSEYARSGYTHFLEKAWLSDHFAAIWVPDLKVVKLEEGKALRPGEILSSLKDFEPEHWGLPPYSDSYQL